MLRLRLTLLVCLFALAGFAARSASAATKMHSHDDVGVRISEYARRFVGVSYRWGGLSPRGGFDCSGFVAYVYRHFGVGLPHYTYSQYARGRHVARRRLAPGDLVFFNGRSHVGLYIGRGRFIHAPTRAHGSESTCSGGAAALPEPAASFRTARHTTRCATNG